MTPNTNPISVNYSNEKLRIHVEEYITQQKTTFTFNGLCSYVMYWAMEEGKTANVGSKLYESHEMQQNDKDRLCHILEKIAKDGRITKAADDTYTSLINN